MHEYAERAEALNTAAQRLLQRLFGCWHHDLGRPFTVNGKSYRVCVKCGMARDFNLVTWKTYGAAYRMRPISGPMYRLQRISSN